ncbi:MAG: hypothetical protein ACLFOY_02625 [Desulfatibacillaceae bacterium]
MADGGKGAAPAHGIAEPAEALRVLAWVLFGVILLRVLVHSCTHPHAFSEDLTFYFSLFRYVDGRFVDTPGGLLFTDKNMVVGISRVLGSLTWLCARLGAEFPLVAASRVLGLGMVPATFAVWIAWTGRVFGRTTATWTALAVLAYAMADGGLLSGLARSFAPLLTGFWLLALSSRKAWHVVPALLACSLFYPVLVPLFGLSLFFATVWLWRGQMGLGRRTAILASGFAASVAYPLARFATAPLPEGARAMTIGEIRATLASGPFPEHLHMERLMGRLAGQTPLEWFGFNVLARPGGLDPGQEAMLWAALALVAVSGGLAALLSRKGADGALPGYTGLVVLAAGVAMLWWKGAAEGYAWWLVLMATGAAGAAGRSVFCRIPGHAALLAPAALVAFVLLMALNASFIYQLVDPGRQLQKAFAVLGPLAAVAWIAWMLRHRGMGCRLAGFANGVLLAVFLVAAPAMPQKEYPGPDAMRAIAGLPDDAVILAHPETADLILAMTGKNTSTASELVRVGVMPYTPRMLRSYARDVRTVYATRPGPVREWCATAAGPGYILVEETTYSKQGVDAVFTAVHEELQGRGPDDSFLLRSARESGARVDEGAWLVPCTVFTGR